MEADCSRASGLGVVQLWLQKSGARNGVIDVVRYPKDLLRKQRTLLL
ncbi:hypothetical protein [Halochromatium glycolicum]|nr:hypothetical protein [Halochromatium glycolicum]